MTRDAYQDRLAELRTDVHSMGLLAIERFEEAIEAATTDDAALARDVIEGDGDLNDLYLDLERDCIELVALQQPVAGDLRLIASSFKVLTDVERVGDLATNVAAYGLDSRLAHDQAEAGLVDLEPLASLAVEMLEDALSAYASDDVEACRAVAERDDELDGRCRRASEAVIRAVIADDPSAIGTDDPATDDDIEATLEAVSTALLTIRDVERVGDHAVNVAARTLYQVENDDELLY